MTRKNYSFYMPDDFETKMKKLQESDDRLQSLSRSQAVYFIVSELCQNKKFEVVEIQDNEQFSLTLNIVEIHYGR